MDRLGIERHIVAGQHNQIGLKRCRFGNDLAQKANLGVRVKMKIAQLYDTEALQCRVKTPNRQGEPLHSQLFTNGQSPPDRMAPQPS